MIQKYYIIATKDKDGFTVPYTQGDSAPILYNDEKSALNMLDFMKRNFQTKIDYVGDKPHSFGRIFKPKNEQIVYSEEAKKEMRWFIANASVKGVALYL